MNEGRLFVGGQQSHRNLTFAEVVSKGTTVHIPPNTTFISHQSRDALSAENVATTLSRQGYPCYLDTFDPSVDGDSPDLESYLRKVIAACTNLMAIVSQATKTSWWVPLEIGVALEKQKHIATYLLNAEDLPSYLWLWPMLRNERDAITWAQDTHKQSVATMNNNWRLRTELQKRSYIL